MKLTGHKAFVTGGSAGIGLELAREFVARGNAVAIGGRSEARLRAAQTAIGAVAVVAADLARPEAPEAMIARAAESLGGLSILVNNAGIQHNDHFASADRQGLAEHIEEEIRVNLTALARLSALALPLLSQCAQAAIVNVSSGLAFAPKASAPVYCVTKAAVHSFSRALRYQLQNEAPHIKVFEIMPPIVDTAMTAGRGKRKMTTAAVQREVFAAFERDRFEVRVGKVKVLVWLDRLFPAVASAVLRHR